LFCFIGITIEEFLALPLLVVVFAEITLLIALVTGFVAVLAAGMIAAELATASWIVAIGVATLFSIFAFASGLLKRKNAVDMMKMKANPKTTQGVYAAKEYCQVLSLYSE
jgi:general stress protein CsbA